MDVISNAIHPKDQMFTGSLQRYMTVGADAFTKIHAILFITKSEPKRILDLACGCGRVARHLAAGFPDSEIVASDLMPHAVEFCAENFGAMPHISAPDLDAVNFDEGFDLIWSGSLMTHLNEANAAKMFSLMARSLKEGGTAIWTVHGRHVDRRYQSGKWPYSLSAEALGGIVDAFRADRYGYVDYEHRKGYGISITPLSWLARQAAGKDDIRIVALIERGWDEHQDIIAIQKRPI